MKITKSRLKRIIKEELDNVLNESIGDIAYDMVKTGKFEDPRGESLEHKFEAMRQILMGDFETLFRGETIDRKDDRNVHIFDKPLANNPSRNCVRRPESLEAAYDLALKKSALLTKSIQSLGDPANIKKLFLFDPIFKKIYEQAYAYYCRCQPEYASPGRIDRYGRDYCSKNFPRITKRAPQRRLNDPEKLTKSALGSNPVDRMRRHDRRARLGLGPVKDDFIGVGGSGR